MAESFTIHQKLWWSNSPSNEALDRAMFHPSPEGGDDMDARTVLAGLYVNNKPTTTGSNRTQTDRQRTPRQNRNKGADKKEKPGRPVNVFPHRDPAQQQRTKGGNRGTQAPRGGNGYQPTQRKCSFFPQGRGKGRPRTARLTRLL